MVVMRRAPSSSSHDRPLPPDMFAEFPLDMSQYPWLFASTRLPTPRADTLVISSAALSHIVVLRGGIIYRVNVLDASGRPLPLAQVHAQMLGVATAAATPASSNPGVLTTMARDDWTAARVRSPHPPSPTNCNTPTCPPPG